MRIGQYQDLVGRALQKRRRVLSVGKPGVGKTFANAEACHRLGWDIIVLCLPLDDPSTIRGYPRPPKEDGGDAVHCLFDGMAKAMRATKPTLLFMDDIGQASESTLKSVMRIVQFGELDGRKLPDCVVIGGATNDVGHGAGVYGLIEPLKSRFHTIIEVETDVDDVVVYGLARGWPSDLLAYLRNSPDALNDWKPSKSVKVDGACPRGWEYVAEWVNCGILDAEVIAGCVGKGRATAYLAYREMIGDLPDLNQVLLDPDGAPVPDNASARYLVAMALASRMDGANFGNAVRYLQRLPIMFRAFAIRDAFRAQQERIKSKTLPAGYQSLASSSDFAAWTVSKEGKDVMAAAS